MSETASERQSLFQRIRLSGRPLANPDSIVVSGSARFTVLTPRLVRMEWSETGRFEDRGTYAFPTRFAPAPSLATRVEDHVRIIDSGALSLHYKQNSGMFTSDNLSIVFELNGERQRWVPGMPNPANLRGTRRTLDRCEGDAALEEGLLSRAGWSLFDDSHSVLFDPDDGWVLPRPGHALQDWYFFGYGHDYKGALAEYTRFGGAIPLIPQFALGTWWSRYWAYSAQDLKDLIRDFEEHDLPLDVLVIDMDWHTPHSWTGYTWNRELFPDPPAFLKWVHEKGLRVSLNLHPAEGVQPFEEIYPRFAEAMGIDPDDVDLETSSGAIPFRITDRQFVKNYFELLHHPMEDDGVDFWWVDWQQGETSEMEGLDPLLWLNHLHFSDSTRRGLRPLVYSRWGGLGNHRYPMGFSGDTFVGWPALQFQPHFTAAASNVAYGWWGHDIGGHMGGPTSPELYARWVQFGMLSPCLRLHATKDSRAERRPWAYPDDVYQAAKAAFHWRHQLAPYICTMARVAHDTGVSLCRPMYYEYPEEDAAYAARYQYFFGDQMIAAPIVQPADPQTGLAATDVWIPEGTWIDYATRETFVGPRWARLIGDLDRVPVLMRAGAILPLAVRFKAQSIAPDENPSPSPHHPASAVAHNAVHPLRSHDNRLILSVFPGAHGRFRLYEDDGVSKAYRQGQHEWTEITTDMDDPGVWSVHIAPVEGRCDILPDKRAYEIRLEGSRLPMQIMLDGAEFSGWDYNPETLTTTIHVPPHEKRLPVTLIAIAKSGISALGKAHNRQLILNDVRRLLSDRCPLQADGAALLDAVLRTESPGLADAVARLGGPFVHFLEFTTPEEAAQCLGRLIVGAPTCIDTPFDLEVTWTLLHGQETERHITQIEGATESQILDAPFAFDGQVGTMYWTAEVQLSWRGTTLTNAYQSTLLFPTIYAWQAIVYNQDEQALTLERVQDDEGNLHEGLNWTNYDQTEHSLINLKQPHGADFSKEYRQELESSVPLAAYLATTVLSPDAREAIVLFRSAGPVEFYLNGQQVEEDPVEKEAWLPGPLRRARSTATVHLRAGRNMLVVHTKPPHEQSRWWYFGGMFSTPDGNPMADLAFESTHRRVVNTVEEKTSH